MPAVATQRPVGAQSPRREPSTWPGVLSPHLAAPRTPEAATSGPGRSALGRSGSGILSFLPRAVTRRLLPRRDAGC